jgi:hypothetical protein
VSDDDNCVSGPQIIASELINSPWVPEKQCTESVREEWEGRVSSRRMRGESLFGGESLRWETLFKNDLTEGPGGVHSART